MNNFTSKAERSAAEPTVSRAVALGLTPPQMSEAERGGVAVEAALASRSAGSWADHERFAAERAKAQQAHDDAIMARVRARDVCNL